ncbi:MAG: DUF4234 domain-containing protein [Chloroflexi bacterium]|nr:MAG: DUF4234 domain-containing protein [Chloroflexota bacterium]
MVDSPQPIYVPRNAGALPQRRGVAFVIVMSIVTVGIYLIYWDYKSFQEVKAYRGRGIGGILGVISSILIVGRFVLPSYVGRMYTDAGQPRAVSAWTGLWTFFPLVGGIAWLSFVQGALNDFVAVGEAAATASMSIKDYVERDREVVEEHECPHCGFIDNRPPSTHCRKCRQPLPGPTP